MPDATGAITLETVALWATIIQGLVVIVSLVIVVYQLIGARRALTLTSLATVYGDLYTEEQYARRERVIYANTSDPKPSTEDLRHVTDQLERVCFLVRERLVPARVIYDMYGKLIIDAWEKVESFVISERTRLNARLYAIDLEELATRFAKRRARRRRIRKAVDRILDRR